jgi:large subunit ribosomal protein L24
MKLSIKKGDKVIVTTGEDKGKTGAVLEVIKEKQRVIIEGVRVQSRHTKPNAQNPQGAIVKQEGSIHISNVAIAADGKPSRIGRREENGKKVRYAKTTGKVIE